MFSTKIVRLKGNESFGAQDNEYICKLPPIFHDPEKYYNWTYLWTLLGVLYDKKPSYQASAKKRRKKRQINNLSPKNSSSNEIIHQHYYTDISEAVLKQVLFGADDKYLNWLALGPPQFAIAVNEIPKE